MWIIVLWIVEFVWESLRELFEQTVLMMPDWDVLILGSVRDDLHQTLDLCLVVEGHAEQLCQQKGKGLLEMGKIKAVTESL